MEKTIKTKITVTEYTGFQFLFALLWMQTVILDYFRGFMLIIFPANFLDYVLFPMLFVGGIAVAFKYMTKHITYKEILFYAIVLIVYRLTYIVYPSNEFVLEKYAVSFALTVLPMIFVGVSLNIEKSLDVLYKISVITIYTMFLYYFVYQGGSAAAIHGDYDMQSAYFVLPHVLLVTMYAVDEGNILNRVTALLGFGFLFMLGTRAPIMICALFFVVYIFFIKKGIKDKKKRAILLSVCAFGIILFKPIILVLSFITRKIGMSDRIFTKMLDKQFFISEGRNTINEVLFEAIGERPLTGYGLGGDGMLLEPHKQIYAHNMFLEFVVDFGFIIGIILSVAVIVILVRGFVSAKNTKERGFIFLLVCSSFLKLMISGTFLAEPMIFMLFGICIAQIRKSNKFKIVIRRKKKDKIKKSVE